MYKHLHPLWKTWGEYYHYPECCVEAFLSRDLAPSYTVESPFYESGFIPCECCHAKTKDLSFEDANLLLGINVQRKYQSIEDTIEEVNILANTKHFKNIANKHNLDVIDYLHRINN